MDAVTGAVVIAGLKYVGKPSAELVTNFLSRILAPAGDTLGQALNHPIAEFFQRKVQQGARTVEGAARIVAETGTDPKPVPGRIFWPLIEKASVEENAELHKRWIALLANASITPEAVLPAFISILGELSPNEAKLLEYIYQRSLEYTIYIQQHPPNSPMNTEESSQRGVEIIEQLQQVGLWRALSGVAEQELLVYQANLERLTLIQRGSYATTSWEIEYVDWPITTTHFGNAFVEACMTPAERGRPASV